jgi:hypothetical protein
VAQAQKGLEGKQQGRDRALSFVISPLSLAEYKRLMTRNLPAIANPNAFPKPVIT